MDNAYLHAIDPFAIHIAGSIGIRWYGLSYLAGFFAAYLIMLTMARRGRSPLNQDLIADFVFSVALWTIIGGRLGYCLIYSRELLTKFSDSFPFWGVLAINEGGMASHGGITGIVIACILFARKHKASPFHLMDLTTLGGSLGIVFGRIANFINGELVGRPCAQDFALAVKFPQDILLWASKDRERLAALGSVADKLNISPDAWQTVLGSYDRHETRWEQLQSLLTTIIEAVQAGNQAVADALRPLLTARHPSQLYEALLEGAIVFIVLALVWRKPQAPGIITGIFFSVYAIGRIIGEQFRMPDPQIGFLWFGTTMGQLLSLALLLIGVVWILICKRSKVRI